MFRQTCAVALAAAAALGIFTTATAQGPKQSDGGQKQITNSIGMKLTLVPSGEFQMGSGESAEKTAAFFTRNYPMDSVAAYPGRCLQRASAAPGANHQTFLSWHVPCHARPIPPVRQRFGVQDGRGERR